MAVIGNIFKCSKFLLITRCPLIQNQAYCTVTIGGKKISAAKLKTIASAITKREHLKVEEDPEKLVKYVCGANINKEGEDPEIKPDSEYPEWLFELRTDRRPPALSEMDKDSYAYWRAVRKATMVQTAYERKTKRRFYDYSR